MFSLYAYYGRKKGRKSVMKTAYQREQFYWKKKKNCREREKQSGFQKRKRPEA